MNLTTAGLIVRELEPEPLDWPELAALAGFDVGL